MTRSFGSIQPPARNRLRAVAQDKGADGSILAEIDIELIELDIPTAQLSFQFAQRQIKQFVPHDMREQIEVDPKEEGPLDFPAGHYTGPIILTEQAVFETANMFYMQTADEADRLPWTEFIYMSRTAPSCYRACQAAAFALSKGENSKGN